MMAMVIMSMTTLKGEKYRSMIIRVKIIAMIIMIMTTTLRGENYDGNDSYDNNDNDDYAEGGELRWK